MKKMATLSSLLALLFIGCSDSGDSSTPPSPKELYQKDMNTLYQASFSSGASTINSEYNNVYTKIFGGSSGYNVASYINTRLAHVWNMEDYNQSQIHPADLGTSKDWLSIDDNEPETNSNVQTEASNNGVALWLIGKIEGKSVTVFYKSEAISLRDPREGIVVLNKSYATHARYGSQSFAIPIDYRISTIVHEARHSDCTGGFPTSYIQKARAASSFESFLDSIGTEQLHCGHMHVECPESHDFAGYSACDKEAWGAYSIGAFYSTGAIPNYPYGSLERELMEFSATDSFSRLLNVPDSAFRTTSPDMGSTHE